MMRRNNIQKLKHEIDTLRRHIKTTEKDILKACEIARVYPESSPEALERQEKHFRTLRRKLSQLQESLNSMLEGQEPDQIHVRKLRRPSNESRLSMFCEV